MPPNCQIKSFYTDGACIGNPGPGGWGTLAYLADNSVHEIGGAEAHSTNNRMELFAAIQALRVFRESGQKEPVSLYTDSEYVKNGITKWIKGWKKKGWKTSQGKAVLNQDLWQILDELNSPLVDWKYVRGHSGDQGNERCDMIARAFANGMPLSLAQNPVFGASQSLWSNGEKPLTKTSNLKAAPESADKSIQTSETTSDLVMTDLSAPSTAGATEELPREVRVAQLRNLVETLRIAEEIASQGYLISSSELADLMDVNASAVTSRGDNWPWRNWIVSRVRREGNQILWQLERVDQVNVPDD